MPDDTSDFAGTDRFTIIRCLGAGGMGVVYEAYDRERCERVALKTLRQFDAATLYRFKQEFRALTETVHPHLIPLYELVGAGDQWFFTMELIENATDMLTYLRPGHGHSEPVHTPATWQTATLTTAFDGVHSPDQSQTLLAADDSWIDAPVAHPADLPSTAVDMHQLRAAFRQLADAVDALHARGKLHRDLKPANVLVTSDGRVVVLDFGLIVNLASEATEPKGTLEPLSPGRQSYHSTDQGLAGTVSFMSPEQAARTSLTPASDWYAVGVMLFQALTGRLPFQGGAMNLLRAKQTDDAPAPSTCVAGIPPDLDALTTALLHRNPEQRAGMAHIVSVLGELPGSREQSRPVAETFVGRDSHLRQLDAAYEAMAAGRTVVCHIAGHSGSGKSTLVDHFLSGRAAAEGAVVLRGQCYEQESMPYKAVDSLVDALTHHLVGLDDEVARQIVPRRMSELVRMFPVLTRADAVARAAARMSDARDLREIRRRATAGLRALLAGLATRTPLVVCIDDLQWGDLDSAELLADLLRPPDAPRMLLLLSYRSEYVETSPCIASLTARARIDRPDDVEYRVDVDALPPDEARALAGSLLGADRPGHAEDAGWIATESGGRPFFIHELAEHLRSGSAVGTTPVLDEIIWQRVARLPDTSRRLLEVVSVAGRPLRIADAQAAADLTALPSQVVSALRVGRLARTTGPSMNADIETFHDRIRESVTAHLALDARREYHRNLAITLERSGRTDAEVLATHFDGAGERERALHYYEAAAARALEVLAFDRAEALFTRAASLATSDADRVRLNERLIDFYTDMARFRDAYAVGRTAVAHFGVKLPARFIPPLFIVDFVAARARLRGRTTADLLALRPADDARLEATVRLMNAVAKAAYQVRPELCVAVATKIVNLCLRHGNTPDCAIGYMVFGSIFHGGVMGNHQFGYDFGRLALSLVDRYQNTRQKAEVHFVVGYFGTSWLRPSTEAEALWRIAYDAGLESGDLFHTGCACAGTTMSYHMRGVPFDTTLAETDRFLEVLVRNRLREPIGVVTAVRQVIGNLRGTTRDGASLDDEGFDEAAFVTDLSTYGSRHFAHFYFIAKMQLLYLWGEHDQALVMAQRSAAYLKDSPGMLHSAEHHFYHALVLLSVGRSRRTAAGTARRLRQWAAVCPDNFLHRAHVLDGEMARTAGRTDEAVAAFASAEDAAAKYGHVHIEALAASLAARTFSAAGRQTDAAAARGRAADAYARWGATALAERARVSPAQV